MEIFKKVQMIKKMHDNLLNDIAYKFNISLNEIKVLVYVRQSEAQKTAQNMVDDLLISKSHVSLAVNNLEEKGYLIRQTDDKDKKKKYLTLTNKVKEIFLHFNKEQKKFKEKLFEGITKNEQESLCLVMQKLESNIKVMIKIKELKN